MTHKCYRRDPQIRQVTDLVTDEQMLAVFQGTNFGHTDFRGLLGQGCIKALAGWHQGHTLNTILTCSPGSVDARRHGLNIPRLTKRLWRCTPNEK